MNPIFSGVLLNKYSVQYFQCPECNYICTEQPYWLEEVYKNPINSTDTGILARNIYLSKISACIIYTFFLKNKKKYLDYGGGYGIFTRLMRDIGFDFYWHDPYTQNLVAQGFEYSKNEDEIGLITSFENFEHFINPMIDLEKIFAISNNIIFSTTIIPDPIPKPEEWWYYGLEHGQHISFYSEKTLKIIAHKFGVNYYSYNDGLHFFTPLKINPILWNLMKTIPNVLFPLIKMKLSSKTFQDMEYLKLRESK